MTATSNPLKVLLVDPSMFTAPYDAGLSQGLVAAGINCQWAVRPLRLEERPDIPQALMRAIFYRRADRLKGVPSSIAALVKGVSHLFGLARLIRMADQERFAVVHMQWNVIPILDTLAIWMIRRRCPVVVTVHDTLPSNGSAISLPQRLGFFWPARAAAEVIVHTRLGASRLVQAGVSEKKINVVPHGPLYLQVSAKLRRAPPVDSRPLKMFLLFGQLKSYKGIDTLVEAVAALAPALREVSRFVIAGAVMMDMEPIEQRIAALGLGRHIELRYGRLSEIEMADLFDEADVFVLPYRAVDASGVFYLLRPQSKWIIASRVGVFAENFVEGVDGETVTPADVGGLAQALTRAIEKNTTSDFKERGASWNEIGHITQAIYERAIDYNNSASKPR